MIINPQTGRPQTTEDENSQRSHTKMVHTHLPLLLITLIGLAFRTIDLDRVELANLFYGSAIFSMGQSLSNFAFAAYDPLGTFMVDKPPLALWIQTLFTKVLGYEGWVMVLPMALAGTAAIPLLYLGVKKAFNTPIALTSALLLAIFPESVATSRDSTMDALVLLMLVLAAIILQRSVELQSRRWLIVWAIVMGLAFNIKYFEAFVALPAFLVYIAVSWKEPKVKAFKTIGMAMASLIAVSLIWVTAIELTPDDVRPRVMNDPSNSVYGLILKYNGLNRVLPGEVTVFQPPPNSSANTQSYYKWAARRFGVGDAGFRLFSGANGPLLGTTSLLALVGLYSLLRNIRTRRRDPSILWIVWAITGMVLFSLSNRGAAHYVESFAPALVVLSAVGLINLWKTESGTRNLIAITLIAVYAAIAIAPFPVLRSPTLITSGIIILSTLAAITINWVVPGEKSTRRILTSISVAGLIVIPAIVSTWITIAAPRGDVITKPNPLVYAYADSSGPRDPWADGAKALDYSIAQGDNKYVLATDSFNKTGELVSRYGMPVLTYWNGYLREPLYNFNELETMIRASEIRYFTITSNPRFLNLQNIAYWFSVSCLEVSREANMDDYLLWDCAPKQSG